MDTSSKRSQAGKTIRQVLMDEYSQIKNRNPRYSLRQFAKKLSVDHSLLSGFLSGKKKLSPKNQNTLLSHTAHDQTYVLSYRSHSSEPLVIDFSPEDLALFFDYRTALISESFNLTRSPQSESKIAELTGVDIAQTKKIMQFLQRYDLIRREQGRWVNTNHLITVMNAQLNTKARSDIFAQAALELNKQITAKKPVNNYVTVVAIDPIHLMEIHSEMNKRMNQLMEKIGRLSKKKTAVYQVLATLHPLIQDDSSCEDVGDDRR